MPWTWLMLPSAGSTTHHSPGGSAPPASSSSAHRDPGLACSSGSRSTSSTAPAMSRSLGRIRKVTGDQILVRTGRSMVPTTRALAMRAEVHALVQQAHHLLSARQELDLAALDRVFTVRWHDALTAACGTT